jgi:DNA repair exonuclease SbcCD ATPase subunit
MDQGTATVHNRDGELGIAEREREAPGVQGEQLQQEGPGGELEETVQENLRLQMRLNEISSGLAESERKVNKLAKVTTELEKVIKKTNKDVAARDETIKQIETALSKRSRRNGKKGESQGAREKELWKVRREAKEAIKKVAPVVNHRNHICPYCGKSCGPKSALRNHAETHTGELRFGCDVCEKRFNTKSNLGRHHRSQHVTEVRRPCPGCDKTFKREPYLTKHLEMGRCKGRFAPL